MRIIVLGAGIAGVTAAWELSRDGHEVVVIDRRGGAALETSFANAGLVAPGHSFTWASPKAPRVMMRSLFTPGMALRVKPTPDPDFWIWSARFLRNCTNDRARLNTLRKHRLCMYAQERLHDIVEETGLAYDGSSGGLMYLYRDAATFEAGVAHMQLLADDGQAIEVLDPAGVVDRDPGLAAARDRIAGAVFCPTDEAGDAHLFSVALGRRCAERGVDFRWNTTIGGFDLVGNRVAAVTTSGGQITGDAYVLALGCESARVGRRLGLRLPIYPVKGYSVTMPVRDQDVPIRFGGVDEDNLVAYCPMGDRLRLTSTAEFAGYDTSYQRADFDAMLAAARSLFPDAADWSAPTFWAGLRPMTPEGTPILGLGKQSNLFLCTGHGHMGWTMASGTARITADLIAGRQPAISLEGMTL